MVDSQFVEVVRTSYSAIDNLCTAKDRLRDASLYFLHRNNDDTLFLMVRYFLRHSHLLNRNRDIPLKLDEKL